VGYLFVEYEGEIASTIVVFAEEGDESVFGLHTLESLGSKILLDRLLEYLPKLLTPAHLPNTS
jgi:hypothetical protein